MWITVRSGPTMWVQDQEVSYPFGRKAPQETYSFGELAGQKILAVKQKDLDYIADRRALSEQMDEKIRSLYVAANPSTRLDASEGIRKILEERNNLRENWRAYTDHVNAHFDSYESSFILLKQNMELLAPGSPVCIRNDAKLNSMTNGRFETFPDLEYEYKNFLFDKNVSWMRRGYLSQHLAKFVCKSVISEELVEVEVREFLERVFSGGG